MECLYICILCFKIQLQESHAFPQNNICT